MEIELPANGWWPRPYQLPLWKALNGGVKRAVAVWHRRAGKDDVDLHWTAVAAHQRVATYWYMLPLAVQARKAIWDAVNPHTGKRRIDEAFPLELRELTRENEMFIRFKVGSTWQVVGSDNFNAVIGSPPAGIVFSEWALSNPVAWAYLRPILLENGGWALFNYTPRGHNHGLTTLNMALEEPDWFAEKLTVDETSVFDKAQLARELKEYIRENGEEVGRALFMQEYYCSFEAPLMGAYWGEQLMAAEREKRICNVPYDPATKVNTWWDLGHSDATAIWFVQHVGQEVHLIDYYENNGKPLDHYASVLEDKRQERRLVYGRHIWPHDGGAATLASKGRPLSGMMADLGYSVEVQPRSDVLVGIHRVRQVLPRCWFDYKRTEYGLEAMRAYRKDEDENRSTDTRRFFKPTPRHDWSSNGADSFRTGCMAHPDVRFPRPPKTREYASKPSQPSAWAA